MPDTKLSDLPSGAPAAGTDLIYAVKDPAGTPSDAKLTLANVKDYILGLANTFTADQTISSASLIMSGNISASTWGTSGIRYKGSAATFTDTSAAGTVAAAYTNVYGGNTIAASNARTFTDYFSTFINAPTAGTNVTFTNNWALGLNGAMKASGQSLSGSQAQSLFDLAATWNTSGTPTAVKLNVTDTASNAASLLMDLQVGGSSKFNVSKAGRAYSAQFYIHPTENTGLAGNFTEPRILAQNNTIATFGIVGMKFVAPIGFTLGDPAITAADVFIGRRAAANLRLGAADAAAPVAQTLSVQSVVAGTTNTAGANLTITGSQGTGTGAGGSIIFQVAPAGSSGTAQNALATALTINSDRQTLFTGGTAALPGLAFSGAATTGFYSLSSSFIGVSLANNRIASFGTISGSANGNVQVSPGGAFSFGTTDAESAVDVVLRRDAANTLALRNGTSAQTYNTYGTYTDASNYRRVALAMTTAGVATLKPEGAGTGASGNVLHISGLPTSNPGPGILWNNGGSVAIGT